jgi:broad specificity phosphatase PhoE
VSSFNSCLELIRLRRNCTLEEVVDHTETFSDVIGRQKLFLQTLLNDLLSKSDEIQRSPTLVVTHGRFIKFFLKEFCSLEVDEISNCSTTTVQLVISKLNHDSDNLSSSLDTSTLASSHSSHPAVPLCEWTIDGITYWLETVTPVEINKTSHL